MRVLVTGASGLLGSGVMHELARRGASVVGFSRTPPTVLPPGTTFVAGDVRDGDAVRRAMAGCDAVAHFAWVVRPLRSAADTDDINLGGTANVLDAMASTGCGRIVFSSSVLAYGARKDNPERLTEADPLRPNPGLLYSEGKAAAERLVADRAVPSVITRSSMIVGRRVGNYGLDLGALPVLVRLGDRPMRLQLLHEDDALRFHADACLGTTTGTVNLASHQVLDEDEAARIAGKRVLDVPPRLVDAVLRTTWRLGLSDIDPESKDALAYWPIVDCTALRDTWGFTCAWDSRAALADFARKTSRTVFLGNRVLDLPWRVPLSMGDGAEGAGADAVPPPGVSTLSADVAARVEAARRGVAGAGATPTTWLRAVALGGELRRLEGDVQAIDVAAVADHTSDEELGARIELIADLLAHSAAVHAVAEAAVAHVLSGVAGDGDALRRRLGSGPPPDAALADEVVRLGHELRGFDERALEAAPDVVMAAVTARDGRAAARLRRLLTDCARWRVDPVELATPPLDDPRLLVAAALAGRNRPLAGGPGRGRRRPLGVPLGVLLAWRHAARSVADRLGLALRAAVLQRGEALAAAGVLDGPDDVWRCHLAALAGPRDRVEPAGPPARQLRLPEPAALLGDGPLVLRAPAVTVPLTALLPAVAAAEARSDSATGVGAVAAAHLGVSFNPGCAPPDAAGGAMTVTVTSADPARRVAEPPTAAR